MKTKFTTLFVLLVIAVLVSACGSSKPAGPATSTLTEEQAIEIATNALVSGFNNEDSVGYVRDMDESMKAAITQEGLVQVVKQYKEKYGNFVSVESAELGPAQTEGNVRWAFTCKFEKGTLYFLLVFPRDGTKVAGAFINEQKP